ncbi:MAG: TolC family protein, partial [Thiotrichaceae bacterium]|nr:TolC family protein [Thiotrichaceae bacterium]
MINSIKTLAYYLSLTGVIFTLTACTVMGPDYDEPSVQWLEEWQPSAYKQKTNKQPEGEDISAWWKIFNDPILNKLIDETKKENYTLKIAGLKIFESRALLAIVNTSIYPQLQQLSGSSTYINKQHHGGNKSDLHYTQNQGDFSVGWELDFWGRFQRSIESADAAFFASISNQQDIQVLLAAQVAASYFSYRTTQARIAIAHKNADIQKRSLEITTNLFESGEGSELDLQQAKTQYYGTLSSIPELEIALTQSRNALAVLLGKAPETLPELESNSSYHWPVISPNQF